MNAFTSMSGGRKQIEKENKASELGLIKSMGLLLSALQLRMRLRKGQNNLGEDLMYKDPPKSCARCKSRSWNTLPQRRLKRKHVLDDEKWMNEDFRKSFPFVTSKARLGALLRQNRLTPANIIQAKEKRERA
jgi:hypothetical protein